MDNMGGSAPPPPPPPPPESGGTGGGFAPKGIGDILSAAFDLYKRNAAQLLMIAAVVVVPLTLIQALLTEVLIDDVVEGISVNEATGEVVVTGGGSSFGEAIIGSVLLGLISVGDLDAAHRRADTWGGRGDDRATDRRRARATEPRSRGSAG